MDSPTEKRTARLGRTEYVVAESNQSGRSNPAAQPCESVDEEECVEWVRERLTALYND